METAEKIVRDIIPELTGTIVDTAKARAYLDRAEELLDSARYRDASSFTQKALNIYLETVGERDASVAKAYYLESIIYSKIGQPILSLQFAQKAVEISQDFSPGQNYILAEHYNRMGVPWLHKSSYVDSLTNLDEALEINRNRFDENHPNIANSFFYLGLSHYHQGDYERSLAFYNRALKVLLNTEKEQQQEIANVYLSMGVVWNSIENYDQALSFYQKALTILLQNQRANNNELADLYRNIGSAWINKGDYNHALNYFQKALNIFLIAFDKEHLNIAQSYNDIGHALYGQGDYGQAVFYFQKALEIYIKVLDEKHVNLALHYNNLGMSLRKKGDYDQALVYFRKALEIYQDALSRNHPSVADTYDNIGGAWYYKGDYDQALACFRKALEIYQNTKGREDPKTAAAYRNLGLVLSSMKDYDEAMVNFQIALEITLRNPGSENTDLAITYNNLGELWYSKGAFDQALDYFQKALKIKLGNLREEHPYLASTYNNLGATFRAKGNINEALNFYQKSLRIKLATLGGDHPGIAHTYNTLGVLSVDQGNLIQALAFYGKATDILQYKIGTYKNFSDVTSPLILHDVLISVEDYYIKRFQQDQDPIYLDSLRTHYQAMIALEDYIQKEYTTADTRQFYAAQSIPVYEGAIANLLERNRPEELPETFLLAEKTKGRQLAEKIQSEPYTASFGLPDSLREREHDLNVDIAYYEKKEFEEEYETQTPNDSLLSVYRDKIFDLRNQRDELLQTFKTSYPDYYNLRYSQQVVSIAGVQDSLLKENDQALVEYFAGDSSLYAFTILPDTFYIQEIKRDFPLEEWVQDLRCGIFAGFVQDTTLCGNMDAAATQAQYTTAAHQLYQKIFAPIDSLLPANARVTIVPDGVLGYLPFDALLTAAPAEGQSPASYPYLLRDHTLSYAYSATLQKEMAYKKHRHAPQRNLLAMAPAFDAQTAEIADTILLATRFIDTTNQRNRLSPLQFNIPEAEAVGELLGGDVVTGPAATEEAFRQRAADYRLLHLSTHGKANDELGDYSFLAFHHLEDSLENEWLYNRELYNLELNADMVVLSACETGIGQLQRGEGIISLARGFSYAGAKSIVTSLWSVNDQSTKVLMESFYRNLKDGMLKDQALRQAKLSYLENNPNLGQEPFFWAAFIPIGDMAPVELGGRSGWFWWTAIIIFMLIAGFLLYRKSGSIPA